MIEEKIKEPIQKAIAEGFPALLSLRDRIGLPAVEYWDHCHAIIDVTLSELTEGIKKTVKDGGPDLEKKLEVLKYMFDRIADISARVNRECAILRNPGLDRN